MKTIAKSLVVVLSAAVISACNNGGERLSTQLDNKKQSVFADKISEVKYRFAANDAENKFFEVPEFKQSSSANEWSQIHTSLSKLIENHKNTGGYSLCIQHACFTMLDRVLLKADQNTQRDQAIKYYLDVLRRENNNYWPLLTKSLIAAQGGIPEADYKEYRDYIISDARQFISLNATLRIETSNVAATSEHAESMEDAENCIKELETMQE